jgi:hypothetical protein
VVSASRTIRGTLIIVISPAANLRIVKRFFFSTLAATQSSAGLKDG